MASRDDFALNQNGCPPDEPDRSPSDSVESFAARYSSLSSISGTGNGPSSSSTSDDMAGLSAAGTSQDDGGMYFRFGEDCHPFAPRGFFAPAMPNSSVVEDIAKMITRMSLNPGQGGTSVCRTGRKRTTSGTLKPIAFSDDNMPALSMQAVSGDDGTMNSRFQVDSSSFVPRAFLASGMPNPKNVKEDATMTVGPSLGPAEYHSPMYPHAKDNGNGFLQPEMAQAPPIRGNYPRPALSHDGGRGLEFETLQEIEALRMFFGPPIEVPAPRKFFGFLGEDIFTRFPFPLVPGVPPTRIDVFTDRKVNYAETVVPFIIQVLNVPRDFKMCARMFQASVESPTGEEIECRVQESDSYIVNSFAGSFRAHEAAGNYQVEVTMTIPRVGFEKYWNVLEKDAICKIRGSAGIVVSKNYGLDSQRDCLRFRCGISELAHPGSGFIGPSPFEQRRAHTTGRWTSAKYSLWGLTCDLRNNNLLYTDRAANVVRCVNPEGEIVFEFGRNLSLPGNEKLNYPTGIDFDGVRNRLIISDKNNHRVCFFTLDGQYISSFGQRGTEDGCFWSPWDVAVSPSGNIAVSDSRNQRVQIFDENGNYLNKYIDFEINLCEYKTEFTYPKGLCFDETGNNLYVTDTITKTVIKIPINSHGLWRLLPNESLGHAQGITMDATGNLLVADSRYDCVRYMNTKGEHLSSILEVVGQKLIFPVNVTTMAGGFVAVLNGNGTINIF